MRVPKRASGPVQGSQECSRVRGQLIRTVKVANDKEGLKNPKGKKKKPAAREESFLNLERVPPQGREVKKARPLV